jgi:hypothetical protein
VQLKQFGHAWLLLAFLVLLLAFPVATPAQRRALRAARLRFDIDFHDFHGQNQSGAERKSENEIENEIVQKNSQQNGILCSSETQNASPQAALEFHLLAGHLSVPTCHLLDFVDFVV